MKILITGYKGYIGSHLFSVLVNLGYYVKGIDLKDGDDLLYCLPNETFDYVFHLAAYPKVQYTVENPSFSLRQNVFVTSMLLEWSKNHGVKRLIFSSSAAVNNGNPKSPYGLHKFMSEMECKLYSEIYDIDTVSLRYFNVYSKDQPYGGSYSTVINSWMEMLRKGERLRIDGDGTQTRDFVHLKDIVSANIFCMQYEKDFNGKTIDVGSGCSVSLNEIKNCIEEYHKVEWDYFPSRKGDIKHSKANIMDLKEMGWKPEINIKAGLKSCFHRNLKKFI
jgi:UDP-glucose 4-epimerase